MSGPKFTGTEPAPKVRIPPHPRHGKHEAAYWYFDRGGARLFAVCRYRTDTGKTFLQGHPNGGQGWVWNLRGITPTLYRLPELADFLERNDEHAPLYLVEGEKAADFVNDYLREHELPGFATCQPMGAGKWRDEYTDVLRGARRVVIVADRDSAGDTGARRIAGELSPHVGSLVLVKPALEADHAGLDDHLAAGLELGDLLPLDDEHEETPAELAAGPLLMTLREFAALQVAPPTPLLGTPETAIIPEAGLVIGAGRPGVGKTTLVLDLACHLAAGLPWPPVSDTATKAPEPWPVPRPLNVALFENEGPVELFREKAKRKLAVFPHELAGYLGVQVWRWGAFSFADDDAFTKAAVELDELAIDLVIGDPLNMLGVEGVGSPDDTRRFVQRLRMLGLGTTRAFLLLHHFRERVETNEDELRKLSGAWGGHLDSLFTLAQGGAATELRLAYPKLRWAQGELPAAVLLGKVYNVAGFEALGLEDDVAMLEPPLVEALTSLRAAGEGYGGKGWITSTNLAPRVQRTRKLVEQALKAAPHLFVMREGERARELGAKRTSKLWGLKAWDDEAPAGRIAQLEAENADLDRQIEAATDPAQGSIMDGLE